MNRRLHLLSCFFTIAGLALFSTDATARTSHKPQAQKAPAAAKKQHAAKEARPHRRAALKKGKPVRHAATPRKTVANKTVANTPPPSKEAAPPLTGDLALVKEAIDLARKAKTQEATDVRNRIADPAAQKLVEWYILRHPETIAPFSRYAAFLAANPEWPSAALLRRRAEARLWEQRSDAATIRSFTGERPVSAKGKLALARVMLADGDRDGAARLARDAWRADDLSERLETDVLATFPDLLTREDHRARMDRRIGAKDLASAKRAAQRLGADELAIVKACAAVRGKADKAKDALDDVAVTARQDLGYTLCRIQFMVAKDQIDEAARLMVAAAPETMALQDTDQWWRERRSLARKLLDQGKFQTAYDVVRPAAMPANEYYRADVHFMCGWIALRYLDDPKTAAGHFARIDEGASNPTVLARANYWRGRAAEALGQVDAMRKSYEAAARYPTAYYGQLARARLGLGEIELRAPLPDLASAEAPASDERLRAADMLYEIGERDVVLYFAADLGQQSSNIVVLEALGDLTGRRNDARAMLQVGKPSLGRGLPLDHYAFPTIGIPPHRQVAPEIEHSMIYSVARTESAFDQRDKSAANAVGLMQVTPEAARDTAKRFKIEYDWDRMVSDPVYNTQIGAAELSALLSEYKGNHIMTFAGYNAGRGRVRDWVKAYGDPRDPKVDPVDWVERIPFSETRNYVQRVIENLAVYRVRFDDGTTASTTAKTDARVVTRETNAAPGPANAAR
ncbi:lytic transglycosylase domain-containing protein [Bradyrhizobium roseum]|uniref:lytic transglycosylase domain-containing protein n=1 Tax=Bradyrhizobium roseum TaxID=3056648 RepID=UPI002630B21D|nr:lytic transglycosylase domain-containing protein [Bradyrhizobium roseus]WKA31750.1 lytic transglycosylase domain-containing protein [Bradyrhizobium roseus]